MSIWTNLFNNPLLAGFIILSLATLILLVLVLRMYFKMRRFLIGIDSKHIGDSLTFVGTGLKELQEFRKELESYLTGVEKRLKKSVQSVHTIRFNPFTGTGEGGNQSFATAFLSEDGNGVVISSLSSRDHARVFSKPITGHEAKFELSGEEREAIEGAREKLEK